MATTTDAHCRNCGSPLYGEHCYACGQPTKGLVRHFSSILGDFADTLLNVDGRLLRTLPALLLKPGFLTREYIDGHRVRYVSPVRLFVFLCIGTFFAAKLATPSFNIDNADGSGGVRIGTAGAQETDGFEAMDSVEAVEARLAEVRAEMAKARAEADGVPGMGTVLAGAEAQVVAAAETRIAELRAMEATRGAGNAQPDEPTTPTAGDLRGLSVSDDGEAPNINFNGKPWHAETNPVVIDTLPAGANRWLNTQVGHIPDNWKRIRQDPDLLRNAFYSALPTALFVLVPVFALLLKVLYVYQRRLYMEHLVSALHGHAFVCAMLLVLMSMSLLETLLGAPTWLSAPLGWLQWLAMLWIPLYLWLHLKRIHGQGVLLTTLNFALLGIAEMVLLSVVASFALVASLVWL